ncbi:hypothetical protein D3C74_124810 [compost metagenome]
MLQDDGVAQHQVRCREARYLVQREVPRHDAQQRTNRALLNDGLAAGEGLDLLVRCQGWSLGGEVLEDLLAEFSFAHGLGQWLAHFGGHDPAEFCCALGEERAYLGNNLGAFVDVNVLP